METGSSSSDILARDFGHPASTETPQFEELIREEDTEEQLYVISQENESQSSDKHKDWSNKAKTDVEFGGTTLIGSKEELILMELLSQVHQSLLFSTEVDKMKSKLDTMRLFMLDAQQLERNQRHCWTVKPILAQIRDLVYEADDIVLDCRLRAEYEELSAVYRYTLHGRFFRRTARYRLLEINKRIEEIENQLKAYLTPVSLMIKASSNEGSSTSARWAASHIPNSSMIVGFENDRRQIIDRIVKSIGYSLQIGISGMGGLGKTVLAHAVCCDDGLRRYFEKFIWITVSQTGTQEDILTSLLNQLMPAGGRNFRDSVSMYDAVLQIQDCLKGRNCLIVMDDVWTMDSEWWMMLSEHLPEKRCIIITTRNEDVAKSMGATYIHRARNLDENEGWSLFSNIAFSANKKMSNDSEFQNVGKDIVRKCQGIPLAIKAIAGVLATKRRSLDQWISVNTNFSNELENTSVLISLQRSYDDLPANLKHCILCFSIYPRDTIISAEQLVYWWVGEGFVHGNGRKTAIEVAFECLSELASRCLVEVEGYRGYNGRIAKCKMHNMVRAMIIKISIEEAFISFDGVSGKLDNNSRHLGYRSRVEKDNSYRQPHFSGTKSMIAMMLMMSRMEEQLKMNKSKMRAFVTMQHSIFPLEWRSGTATVNSLRVLDLSQSNLENIKAAGLFRFIKSQERLAYLNLRGVNNFKELPDWIRKRWNLQILVINECKSLQRLFRTVNFLQNLVVLDVQRCPCLELSWGLGNLTKLQVLRGLKSQSLVLLKNLAELRELTIELSSNDEIEEGEKYLSQLPKLMVLSINKTGSGRTEVGLMNRLEPPPSITELYLQSYDRDTTPDWLTPSSLPNLLFLDISGGQLKSVCPNFWEDNEKTWRIEGLCFKYLPRFELDWGVVQSNMKYLRYAEVKLCPGLKSFPLDTEDSGVWEKEEESE